MKHLNLLATIKEKYIAYSVVTKNKNILIKTIFFCFLLNSPLLVNCLYATNYTFKNNIISIEKVDGDKKISVIDSISSQKNMLGIELQSANAIGTMILDGDRAIEIKNDRQGLDYVGTYPIVPSGHVSWLQGTGDPSWWRFDGNGNLSQFDQRVINYIAATPVTIPQSGRYSIKGVVFVGQVIFPPYGVPGTDVGYIKNKKIKVALTKGGPYNGGGTLMFSGMYDIDFNQPVSRDVNGPWLFSIKACNLGNTHKLTTSTCLDDLYYMTATASPFMKGSINRGNHCYNSYDRVVESGTFSFEYSSVPTPPYYNGGEQIWLTLVSVNDRELANVSWDNRMFNVSVEIFLSYPAP